MTQEPTNHEQFKTIINALAGLLKISRNKLFDNAPKYGRTTHWMRERYYGRATVDFSDIEWARALAFGKGDTEQTSKMVLLAAHQKAVLAFCTYCDGGDDPAEATCWDRTCPLRIVSPLPLRDDANKRRLSSRGAAQTAVRPSRHSQANREREGQHLSRSTNTARNAKVRAWIDSALVALNLLNWTVTLADDVADIDAWADIEPHQDAATATLRLSNDFWKKSKEEKRNILTHELLHLAFARQDQLVENLAEPLG
ncbi:MAG: hypothetical protein ACKN9R_05395, partial [Candidatus Limnocylindrus sp.]